MPRSQPLPLRIRLLRRLNPAIIGLLRSPLHGILSRNLLVLEYRGRKTGKSYTIPLSYVTQAGVPHCFTRDAAWCRSAVEAESVTVWLRGVRQTARAERSPSTEPATSTALATFLARNPGTSKLLYGVRIDAAGRPNESDLAREVHNSHVVRLMMR